MTSMGSNRAPRSGVRSPRTTLLVRRDGPAGRHTVTRPKARGVGDAPSADRREGWPAVGSRRGLFPVRSKKLIAALTGVVVVVAAVVFFAAHPAAPRGADTGQHGAGKGRSHQGPAPLGRSKSGSGNSGAHSRATSPSTAGLAAAQAALPRLTPAQLAGQRGIYSYNGPTPPAQMRTT